MSIPGYAIEHDDRYSIPLENRAVSRCYVDTALGIQLFEDGLETTIRIEGHFLVISQGQEQKLQPSQFEELGIIFSLIEKTVISAAAYKNGR